MKIGASTLRVLLENNVLEIKFKRRRSKPGSPTTRRMLCTNCPVILQSDAGRETLHYEQSNQTLSYNPAAKNIVIAWDLFKQDYRAISVDNCELISQMPVSGDGTDFWQYFNETIYPMSSQQKEAFFNA
jgi:hypothetical protein